MGTATKVRDLTGFNGEAALYRLDPPLRQTDWNEDETGRHEYVVVSAVIAMFSGPETYIFPADADGEITSWYELSGSYRGGLSHFEALDGAGYSIGAEA